MYGASSSPGRFHTASMWLSSKAAFIISNLAEPQLKRPRWDQKPLLARNCFLLSLYCVFFYSDTPQTLLKWHDASPICCTKMWETFFAQIYRCTQKMLRDHTVSCILCFYKKKEEKQKGRKEGKGEDISLREGNLIPCGWDLVLRVKDCVGWRGKMVEFSKECHCYCLHAFDFLLLFVQSLF